MEIKFQSHQDSNGMATLTIQGAMDTHTSPQISDHLSDLFKTHPRAILVDLSMVTFINSLGLATLLDGLKWSHSNLSRFLLTGLTPMVKDVMAIAHLLPMFEICDSKEEALNSYLMVDLPRLS